MSQPDDIVWEPLKPTEKDLFWQQYVDSLELAPVTYWLSPEEFDRINELVKNPRPPTQALIDLFRKHG